MPVIPNLEHQIKRRREASDICARNGVYTRGWLSLCLIFVGLFEFGYQFVGIADQIRIKL